MYKKKPKISNGMMIKSKTNVKEKASNSSMNAQETLGRPSEDQHSEVVKITEVAKKKQRVNDGYIDLSDGEDEYDDEYGAYDDEYGDESEIDELLEIQTGFSPNLLRALIMEGPDGNQNYS